MAKVYLYKEGDERTEITGGWDTKYGNTAIASNKAGWSGNPTRTKEEDHLLISIPDQSSSGSADSNMVATWYTNNKVDLTDFDSIVFDIETSFGDSLYGGNYSARISFMIADAQYGDSRIAYCDIYSNKDDSNNKGKRRTIELDVSDFSGEYYIILYNSRGNTNVNSGDDSSVLIAYNVWLDDGKKDRIFQPGIIGKTNVVEGAVIPIGAKLPDSATLLMHLDESLEDKLGLNTPTLSSGSGVCVGR